MKTKRVSLSKDKPKLILKNAQLMSDFLSLGYRTRQTFEEIFKVHYPEAEIKEIRRLWNIRSVDSDLIEKLENLINRLKQA